MTPFIMDRRVTVFERTRLDVLVTAAEAREMVESITFEDERVPHETGITFDLIRFVEQGDLAEILSPSSG